MNVTKISIPSLGCLRELWIARYPNEIEVELIEQIKQYPIRGYATHIVGETKVAETNTIQFYYAEFIRWETTGD